MMNSDEKKYLFEKCPINESIMKLAIPSVMGQIILVIYNMADTFFIGLTNDDAMIAAVTICMPAFMLLSAISNLFGVGGASVISRAIGRKNKKLALQASSLAFWGCLSVTIFFSLLVWLTMDPFVNLLGGANQIVHMHTRSYLLITVVFGGVTTSSNMLLSHLIRSEGRSLQASIGIFIGGILNIILDPIFMFFILKPGNEVVGAAIATVLSNLVSSLYLFFIVLKIRSVSVISLTPNRSMLRIKIFKDMLISGLPAFMMTSLENISYAVLGKLISLSGIAMQAGIGVAKKVNMLAHSIVRGMAQGVLPLIGYNYGSKNYKRMKNIAKKSTMFSLFVTLFIMVFNLSFSKSLIGIFIHSSSDSLYYGAKYLQILSLGAPFSAVAYQFISFFQATGHGRTSLILAVQRKGALDIPLMFFLIRINPIFGVVWATPLADIVCCLSAIVAFKLFTNQHTTSSTSERKAA